jgi:hypothetical protein
MTACLEVFKKF